MPISPNLSNYRKTRTRLGEALHKHCDLINTTKRRSVVSVPKVHSEANAIQQFETDHIFH